jgi:thiamine-phosphate pyrophosphorylase
VAAACLRGGASILQLRVKRGASAPFLALADDLVAAAGPYAADVIVNDRADIARMAGATGVHVGQEDLPPDAARTIVGSGVVGLSTHDERQVDEGLRSTADYIAVGPVYQTQTKDTGYVARGLALVRYAAGRGKPIVAIGGITLETAPRVLEAGAVAVAVISDLLAGSAEERVRRYLRTLA